MPNGKKRIWKCSLEKWQWGRCNEAVKTEKRAVDKNADPAYYNELVDLGNKLSLAYHKKPVFGDESYNFDLNSDETILLTMCLDHLMNKQDVNDVFGRAERQNIRDVKTAILDSQKFVKASRLEDCREAR